MKKMYKIKKFEDNLPLTEAYQESGMRFAFLSAPKDGNRMCHQFVKCRDYLHDVVRSCVTKKPAGIIYGFNFDPNTNPSIDLKRIRLLIKDCNKDKAHNIQETLKKAILLLNHYERLIGIKAVSTVFPTNIDNTFAISGPKFWLRAPQLTSLYTLLIRISEFNINFHEGDNKSLEKNFDKLTTDGTKSEYHDLVMLYHIKDFIPIVLEHYKEIFDIQKNGYSSQLFDEVDISTYHNYGGIYSLVKGNQPQKGPTPRWNKVKDNFRSVVMAAINKKSKNKEMLAVYIKGDIFNKYSSNYEPTSMRFAFVNDVNGKRFRCHKWCTCREYLIGSFRSCLKEGNKNDFYITGDQTIINTTTDKLRLLVSFPGLGTAKNYRNDSKNRMFFAKRVLNYYEKQMGIKKSVISTVKLVSAGTNERIGYAWLITGSYEWVCSPVMISLCAMILRAANTYAYHMNKSNTIKKITDFNYTNICHMWETLDKHNYWKKTPDKLLSDARLFIFLRKWRSIIDINNTARNFYVGIHRLKNNPASVYTKVGINSLVLGNHLDKNISDKFLNLVGK